MFPFWVRLSGLDLLAELVLVTTCTCDIYDGGGSCGAGRVWRGRKNLTPLALPMSLNRVFVVKVKLGAFAIAARGPGADIRNIGPLNLRIWLVRTF